MIIGIASSLGTAALQACLDSLYKSCDAEKLEIIIKPEINCSRETTYNAILDLVPNNKGVFLIGDDITFTPGWYEAFKAHQQSADVIGFTTLFPGTETIQQAGYQFVQLADRIYFEPVSRGMKFKKSNGSTTIELCDSLSGCTFYISPEARAKVPRFDQAGLSRWGNVLYCCDAKREKLKVGVLSHPLFHAANSTKSNSDKRLSSISYLIEKQLWDPLSESRIDPAWVRRNYTYKFSKKLEDDLLSNRTLLYGAGVVAELLVKTYPSSEMTIVSGLPEEIGENFFDSGKVVKDVKQVLTSEDYDLIIISVIGLEEKIFLLYFSDSGISVPIKYVREENFGDAKNYSIAEIEV